jgi:hypothetical protein
MHLKPYAEVRFGFCCPEEHDFSSSRSPGKSQKLNQKPYNHLPTCACIQFASVDHRLATSTSHPFISVTCIKTNIRQAGRSQKRYNPHLLDHTGKVDQRRYWAPLTADVLHLHLRGEKGGSRILSFLVNVGVLWQHRLVPSKNRFKDQNELGQSI